MEQDEIIIALRVVEPILIGKMERVLKLVATEFKSGRLTQEAQIKLKADYDAARSLLQVLTEAAGGQVNG